MFGFEFGSHNSIRIRIRIRLEHEVKLEIDSLGILDIRLEFANICEGKVDWGTTTRTEAKRTTTMDLIYGLGINKPDRATRKKDGVGGWRGREAAVPW